jgi:hypothetical protein
MLSAEQIKIVNSMKSDLTRQREILQSQAENCIRLEALLETLSAGADLTDDSLDDNSIRRGTAYLISFRGEPIASTLTTAWDYMVPLLRNPGRSFNPLELRQRVNAPAANGSKALAARDMMTGDEDNNEPKLRETKTGQAACIYKLQKCSLTELSDTRDILRDKIEKAKAENIGSDMHTFEDQLEIVEKVIRDYHAGKWQYSSERDPAYTKAYDLIYKHHQRILKSLKIEHRSLYEHFQLHLNIGNECIYNPKPIIMWNIF